MIRMANILLLALLIAAAFKHSEQTDSLKISVYYETLCPDSRNFLLNQLTVMMGEFNEYPSWLTLDLVPYGKANETGTNKYKCQHGPRECLGNRLDACAIDLLVTNQTTPLYMRLVNYIYCTENADDPVKSAKKCATQVGVNYKKLMKCYNGSRGWQLMEQYKNRTAAIQQYVSGGWVPTIIFNDVFNLTQSEEAQSDLYTEVCGFLPDQCE